MCCGQVPKFLEHEGATSGCAFVIGVNERQREHRAELVYHFRITWVGPVEFTEIYKDFITPLEIISLFRVLEFTA